jgi:hypothetical protein
MRYTIILLTGLALVGCSDHQAALDAALAERDAQLAEKDARFNRDRQDLIAEVARVRSEANQLHGKIAEVERDYEQRLKLKSARVDTLEAELKKERAAHRKLKQAPSPAVDALPIMVEPDTANVPIFPVGVSGVTGIQAVIGTNSYTKTIETEELYRDEFGNKKPVLEYEDVITYDYVYRVACILDNLTERPLEVELRAGIQYQTFQLMPGERGRTVEINAAKGSSLFVIVGGETRRFDVSL